jgi:hypothetical protein
MIRKLVTLISLSIPTFAFAISCPNNGTSLATGYTIQKVIQLCGNPVSTSSPSVTNNPSEKWVYYKKGSNNQNAKITILFNNSRLVNIQILSDVSNCAITHDTNISRCAPIEQNFTSSQICGGIIQANDNADFVLKTCGAPSEKVTVQSTNTTAASVTELSYTGQSPNILVFENGLLKDWKAK